MILHERDLTEEDWLYLDSLGLVRYNPVQDDYDQEEVFE